MSFFADCIFMKGTWTEEGQRRLRVCMDDIPEKNPYLRESDI